MAITAFFGKRGNMRIYFGTTDGSGGFYYFPIIFEAMDASWVAGRPRPDEIPVMDRGNLNNYAHHIQGPDTPIIQPQPLTFSCMIDNTFNRTNLLLALGNIPQGAWTIGGVTLSNVNGTTQVYNGAGSLVSTPLPYDVMQDRVNVQIMFLGDPNAGTLGLDDYGFALNEVWFQPGGVRLAEAPDSLKLNANGSIMGPISHITAFGAGTTLISYTGI